MTAEPRDVEEWCGSPVSHEPHPGCSGWPSVEARDFIETAKILAEPYNETIAALEVRLAAADRENAELRGELAGIPSSPDYSGAESCCWSPKHHTLHQLADECDDLRAQLAAAQAQLAEAQREAQEDSRVMLESANATIALIRQRAELEARLEAVRGYVASARATESTDHAAGWNLALTAVGNRLAALSAAPQPEPEYRCAECQGEITTASDLISVNVDGHAKAAHRDCSAPHHYSRGYPISHAEHAWDNPAPERAYLLVAPEPPASDEPARCEHDFHATNRAGDRIGLRLAGAGSSERCPAASGTPDGRTARVLTDDEVDQIREAWKDPDYVRRLAADMGMAGRVEVDNPFRREQRPRRGTESGTADGGGS